MIFKLTVCLFHLITQRLVLFKTRTSLDHPLCVVTIRQMTYKTADKSDRLLSPAAPKARDGRYCNAPRPSVCLSVRPSVCLSVCLSVTFSFRTVTQKRIAVFSRNFADMCTKSWGCAVMFLMLMECCLNFV